MPWQSCMSCGPSSTAGSVQLHDSARRATGSQLGVILLFTWQPSAEMELRNRSPSHRRSDAAFFGRHPAEQLVFTADLPDGALLPPVDADIRRSRLEALAFSLGFSLWVLTSGRLACLYCRRARNQPS